MLLYKGSSLPLTLNPLFFHLIDTHLGSLKFPLWVVVIWHQGVCGNSNMPVKDRKKRIRFDIIEGVLIVAA